MSILSLAVEFFISFLYEAWIYFIITAFAMIFDFIIIIIHLCFVISEDELHLRPGPAMIFLHSILHILLSFFIGASLSNPETYSFWIELSAQLAISVIFVFVGIEQLLRWTTRSDGNIVSELLINYPFRQVITEPTDDQDNVITALTILMGERIMTIWTITGVVRGFKQWSNCFYYLYYVYLYNWTFKKRITM